MSSLTDRVSVIAVGINRYRYLPRLQGPEADVSSLKELLVTQTSTAVLPEHRFRTLVDADSASVRGALTDYALGRSAPHDILFFYFSGHATPIDQNDLGLCTIDTQIHPEFGIPIPMNLVRFRDIVETLVAVKTDPMIVIDACYSGRVAGGIQQVYESLKRTVQSETGSTYALLCSSTRLEETPDARTGGPFSMLLTSVASRGLGDPDHKRKQRLTIKDLYPQIRRVAETELETTPQLIVGDTFPDFEFVQNCQYEPRRESLTRGHKEALFVFWNNGCPRDVTVRELQPHGSTVHTTHNKLTYGPSWALIEKVGTRNKKRLTARGEKFMRGELKIPYDIEKNPTSEEWRPAEGTKFVSFEKLSMLFPDQEMFEPEDR